MSALMVRVREATIERVRVPGKRARKVNITYGPWFELPASKKCRGGEHITTLRDAASGLGGCAQRLTR